MAKYKYKAVFLDFYGTLAAGDAEAVERVCQAIVHDLDLELGVEDLVRRWGDRFFASIEVNNHSAFRNLYECECVSLVETIESIGGRIDPQAYVDRLTAYWQSPTLHPEAHEVLESLDLPVCCVSNADTADLLSAIEKHKLCFDDVVSSEDARCYKPDGRIFELAMRRMGVLPDEVVHVGDSLHSDVEGARRAGIDAIWLSRSQRIYDIGQNDAIHKIISLDELHAMLS